MVSFFLFWKGEIKMTRKELLKLTDEELRGLSLRKNKNGCETSDARKAQEIRQERSGYWVGVDRVPPSYEETLAEETGIFQYMD